MSGGGGGGGGFSSPAGSNDKGGSGSGYADFGPAGPSNQNTVGEQYTSLPAPPGLSYSTAFGPSTSGPSGVGTPGSTGNPFSSLADPGGTSYDFSARAAAPAGGSVFDTGAPAFDTFGGTGSPLNAASAAPPAGVAEGQLLDPTQQQPSRLTPEQLGFAQAPPAGAPQAPPAAPAPAKSEGFGETLTRALTSPNALIGAAGLGYSIYQGQQQSNYEQALAEQAAQLNERGKALAGYLESGNLPPGLRAGLDQATEAAKANARSNFAAQGLSTDPTKNTALAATLAAIDRAAIVQTALIGQQLLDAGAKQSGIASNLYQALAQIDQTQTNRIGQAVARFAAAMSPTRGLTRTP